MNLLNNIKGVALKGNNFKRLGLAVVVLASISVICWKLSPQVKKSDPLLQEEQQAETGCNHVHSHGCGHDHSVKKRVIKKVAQVRVSRSSDVLDAGLIDAEMGDVLELSFGDELQVQGKVNMKKEVVGGRTAMSLGLTAKKGYLYWLQDAEGGVIGNVVIKRADGNQVYKFKKQAGNWTVQKLDFQEYICASGKTDETAGLPASPIKFKSTEAAAGDEVPVLNSLASAQAVIYLDFDGEVVSGTRWNAALGGADIDAQPAGYTAAEMQKVWEETSEDMRPFNINVTTSRAVFEAAPVNRRMHMIITPTADAQPDAGGVAYLESFYDGTIDPCWNFNLDLSASGMTNSHEVGHTFGLRHDGDTRQQGQTEYHEGNGVWGPIMGAPFDMAVVNWSNGNYEGATNKEDDLAIITALGTNGFGYREDKHGNTNPDAALITNEGNGESVVESGVIEKTEDVDVFSFRTSGGLANLNIKPVSSYPNINIQAALYDEAGNLIVRNDGADYAASISETLNGGIYYLHVEGIADGSPDQRGFNDYGSLGQFGITGNVAGLGGLILNIVEPKIDKVSVLFGNGLFLEATIVGNADSFKWTQLSGPSGGVVTFASDTKLKTRAKFSKPGLYEIQLGAQTNGLVTNVTMQVSVEALGDARHFANRGPAISVTSPEEFYSREGTLSGQVTDDNVPVALPPAFEWVVISGNAKILNPAAPIPVIKFEDSLPNLLVLESSDGQIKTFKEVTVSSVFEVKDLVDVGTSARWFVPLSDNLGMSWVTPQFNDAAWSAGKTGLGFNKKQDYLRFIGVGGNLQSVMKKKSPSAFVRIPFTLPSLNYVQQLVLKMRYNDGFVAYLNGVEFVRRNVPAGPLVWSSKALTSRSLADVIVPDEIDLFSGLAHANLKVGENVLAIHGLNSSKSGSEFLIAPKLEAGIVAAPYLSFLEQYGGGLMPMADEDGDDLPNLAEHALGTNPTVPDAYSPVTVKANASVGIKLPLNMPQDVKYTLERSSNLKDWRDVALKIGMADWVGSGIQVSIQSIANGYITYQLRPLQSAKGSYFRLRYDLRRPEAQ